MSYFYIQGVGNRESGAVRPKGDLLAHWKAHRGNRERCDPRAIYSPIGKRTEGIGSGATQGRFTRPLESAPRESVKAGNGENYPGNYCVF
ncbi:hypothetical protein BJP36_40835 [Moorena producens JHB]|uniref:Uncharacterized protein n=1 Tax=Moorena producens (strain JHB) TaxID=1454205 RepID=A0A9Q9SSA5_MOOP1|nr:hypothetical protein [Moorena producens]WAN68712.1 hypothetical protein BJP36_40835 [Moorena producens JHB]